MELRKSAVNVGSCLEHTHEDTGDEMNFLLFQHNQPAKCMEDYYC